MLLALLAGTGACGGPVAPSAPPVASLVGTWSGAVTVEGHEGTAVLTFTRSTPSVAGTWEWDVPALGWRGRGLVYVTRDEPRDVSLVFEPETSLTCVDGSPWTNFLADVVRDGDQMAGVWYRFLSPCRQGTLRLRRTG